MYLSYYLKLLWKNMKALAFFKPALSNHELQTTSNTVPWTPNSKLFVLVMLLHAPVFCPWFHAYGGCQSGVACALKSAGVVLLHHRIYTIYADFSHEWNRWRVLCVYMTRLIFWDNIPECCTFHQKALIFPLTPCSLSLNSDAFHYRRNTLDRW